MVLVQGWNFNPISFPVDRCKKPSYWKRWSSTLIILFCLNLGPSIKYVTTLEGKWVDRLRMLKAIPVFKFLETAFNRHLKNKIWGVFWVCCFWFSFLKNLGCVLDVLQVYRFCILFFLKKCGVCSRCVPVVVRVCSVCSRCVHCVPVCSLQCVVSSDPNKIVMDK